MRLDTHGLQKPETHLNKQRKASAQPIIKYVSSYQVRCPTPVHLAGSEAVCLVPVRRVVGGETQNKDELKMKYPQFCCVSCQKSTSVKLLLPLQRFLCASLSLSLSLVPSGAPVCYFCPHRGALCARWLLGARFVIGHPHCRAAPQTICLRSFEWGGAKKKQRHRKTTTTKTHKTFPQLKQSVLVH